MEVIHQSGEMADDWCERRPDDWSRHVDFAVGYFHERKVIKFQERIARAALLPRMRPWRTMLGTRWTCQLPATKRDPMPIIGIGFTQEQAWLDWCGGIEDKFFAPKPSDEKVRRAQYEAWNEDAEFYAQENFGTKNVFVRRNINVWNRLRVRLGLLPTANTK